ncbi:hypothetical protein [Novosphingobium kaempferiae]|uniref:hypothetical protein n=1 Tax=Novosphingobium kaempferiae TaxID=2896849 RepID=UPI001E2E6AFF|nr:hypothetical protein [Novosphingobium kaempferiae]
MASLVLRVLAGTLGAFATGALATTVLSLILARLGVSRADAVTITLMVGPAILALICLAAFHSRDPARLSGWLAAAAAALAITCALLRSSLS